MIAVSRMPASTVAVSRFSFHGPPSLPCYARPNHRGEKDRAQPEKIRSHYLSQAMCRPRPAGGPNLVRVTTGDSIGLAGVVIPDGAPSVATDADGWYTLTALPAGSYTLRPALAGYHFSPATRSITLDDTLAGQDFTASSEGPAEAQSLVPTTGDPLAHALRAGGWSR